MMKKMAVSKPTIESQNNSKVSLKSEPIVLLLTHDLLIRDISQSGIKDFFGKEKHEIINASFIDLLVAQQINTDELLSVLKSNSNLLSHHVLVLECRHLRKEYPVTIITLHENNKTQYVITLNVLDNSYETPHSCMNTIINNLPGAVYWKDKEGRYMGCNKFVATMAGFARPEDMIGKTDYDLCWHEFADDWRLLDNMVIQEDATIEREEKAKLANGKIITELTFKTPLKNQQGETIGVIGTSLDITERKQLEAALKESKNLADAANQAKTEFLANMRHDIRTPLSGIVGFSDILKQESTEPRIKEYAENLVASSHALLELMDEVLEAVRVSSGEIPMLKKKFNLLKTFEHVVALQLARAHEKNLHLKLELDENLPQFVIGDKIRVHRIALELVGNALNFTDDGHVTLRVELAKSENHNLVIKLTVTDSGMGIPKDKQQEIYVQFKRLTPSYQGIYKGAGLGLFVVKQFIDELNGEIYVESELHKGTCFTCLIPLQEPLLDDESGVDMTPEDLITEKPYLTPMAQQIKPSPVDSNTNATINVLVIEDNTIAQMAAKCILTSLACRVDVAADGAEALTLCQAHRYHLIFMDIGLGEGMDGYEVTHHIRKRQDMVHTPIIALTAHAADENKQRCIEAGMDAVLTKPLTQVHATDILKAFVPERQAATVKELPSLRRDLPDSDEELFHLDQFALLDIEQGLENCGDNSMLIELLTMMATEEIPADLEKMRNAFETQDYALVEKIAHKIKGGAVYVGTTRMKYACQYVERYWKTGERKLFDKLYCQATITIKNTCTAIADWLTKNSND